ncbi:MAG: replication factor C small subunit [Methanocellales archaeon]|nr:replication factor C small subunit [Methanocellales archaeon]
MWTEKYRPRTLGDVVGQDQIVERLKSYVKTGGLPHLLFAGPSGVGKTAAAIALTRDMFGEGWRNNFTELNASDERGIDVVRNQIKNFARTAPLGKLTFKIIFLDESDALTPDAQSALRRTMERFTTTCRFILSCNYSSKIIEPIQSRCAVYRFRPISDKDVEKRIKHIVKEEKLKLADDGLEAIKYVARGDLRRAINTLQSAAVLGKKIDAETIYQTVAMARPEEVNELIELALKGDFMKARDKLDVLLIDQGLSGEDVIDQIHGAIANLGGISEKLRVELLDKIGEADFRLTEGANERIQLEALIAHFTLAGKK